MQLIQIFVHLMYTCAEGLNRYTVYKYYNMHVLMAKGVTQHKKASNHHTNLPLEMYSFTL